MSTFSRAARATRHRASAFSSIGFCLFLALLPLSCSLADGGDDALDCPQAPRPIPPFTDPVWHPNQDIIGYNLLPLLSIDFPNGPSCPGRQNFDPDGFVFQLFSLSRDSVVATLHSRLFTPAWAPTGDALAFETLGNIYVVRVNGADIDSTSISRITHNGLSFRPSWSPDGDTIAYVRSGCVQTGTPPDTNSCGVLLMGPDGQGKRFFIGGLYPSWTPDSASILFIGQHEEVYRVLVADPDSVVQLTSFNQDDQVYRVALPKMAPDGTHIAFTAKDGNGLTNLWLIRPDGTELQQLTTEGTRRWLSWAPNSTEIVYVSYRYDDWSLRNGTVWVVDVQSRQRRQLVGP